MSYAIEMRHIRKEFPGIVANDDITLQVEEGEIHALFGENGAGKSTLMNVLFGLYQPDQGEIYVHGKKAVIHDPNDATRLGIGMVHQHFMLIDKFTVAENIVLGKEPKKHGLLDMAKAVKIVKELSEKYGLDVDPNQKVEDITVGMQQRVEILKTLYRGSDILIFDEPTAVLTPLEIQELIVIMKRLVKEGKSIILITHKLKEIFEACDRCTVIRRGKNIDSVAISDTNPSELASMMVGRKVNVQVNDAPYEPKEKVLEVDHLTVLDSRKVNVIKELNLTVHGGEILGIAGVDGNGQTELIEAIAGLRKVKNGRIKINGQDVTNQKTRKIIEAGLGYIPEDRQKHGLVLDFSIGENMVLQTYYKKPYAQLGILQNKVITKKAKQLIQEFDVRTPSEKTLARSLSGGNQQKVIVAREVDRSPELLIAAQPTRGLDIGAIEFIHGKLIDEKKKGKAVLLVSFELDEILRLSDRIAVIYEGNIIDIVNPKETDENELGLLMAGRKKGGNQA
ncbi:ABC transporter ATP-binding protein [Sporolactobacillus laevolacticus]|uniref:Heme ABC transporter ATP-binding protein n=1 Tax=Sporolactobacillus laevolacticus DSM 442 TaxID=1395513 RepID=V6IY81_9BACL|nr:ABC transporter ATP-binding protein [Sporolactobacillus laevolacticus]EST12367.1 heme ABC transporter ATP-binding protein [Sporolactobacillus laevolacticus DSM 442]